MPKFKITFGKTVLGEKTEETLVEEFDTKEEAEQACTEYALELVQDMIYGFVDEIDEKDDDEDPSNEFDEIDRTGSNEMGG